MGTESSVLLFSLKTEAVETSSCPGGAQLLFGSDCLSLGEFYISITSTGILRLSMANRMPQNLA